MNCHECGLRVTRECGMCGAGFCRRHGTECDRCLVDTCSQCLAVFEDAAALCRKCDQSGT